ncbi:MAG: PAS domain-containing sensor histidine kinase [Myxococcales bacterium]|nr:PAS domain-containing sensor histidine kinase [Myxococcales bacterium]
MNARELADTQLIDGLPALKLLEGLARLYQLVLVVDREDRIQWMSDELRRLSGNTHGHVGQDVHRVFPKLPRPEQMSAIRSQLRTTGFLSNMRIDVSGCDGEVLLVDISILPISTEESESPLMAVIARRVSDGDGDRTEDAGGLEAVLESAPDGVVAVDERGFVTYANAAVERILGYSREQLRDRPIALLARHPADVERLASSLGPEEQVRDWDLELRCSGGTAVVVSASAGALRRADGSAGGTVLFLREGTHRREAEAALGRENAELEHCIQTLAHDLRSPLVALLGFSRLLRQDYGESLDDTGSHFLDRIEQSGRTMEVLIREILELSRIGHSGERRSPVDPRAVLLQIGAEIKPRLDAQGIRLSIPDTPPVLFCDRTRLYQLFSNLIGNAVDHMGPCDRPLISVRIEESADHHHLSVSDTGQGIPPEHHEEIFEVFRSLGSRTDGRRGTGIGLAIVRKIAETHSGRAWVESRPGAGTTFHVTLSRS